ncbi:MAG: ferredoxin [Candidatus Thermoplasmatota archaeon]|nr:ferredoxin [Candidatus Thermoplasmatota archaeon]
MHSCIRCVACVGSCPSGAIAFRSNTIIIDGNTCTRCLRCVLFCPEGCFEEGP